jgi:hypothetical protein
MYIRVLAFLVLVLVLSVNPTWATSCGDSETTSCTNTISPADTTATYEFGGNGRLVVQFETVLTTFDLTVSLTFPSNPLLLDPNEFPAGTVCVQYPDVTSNDCVVYNFSGTAGGPNGVPIKNTNYKGLISLTLSYLTSQTVHTPAFGHAPGDISTFTENILTSYSNDPTFSDPTMGGRTPGLSSVVALDEPLVENDTSCGGLTLTPTNNPSQQKPEIEVTLKIATSPSACSGTGIRDKTASVSVSTTDGNGNIIFVALKNVEGNKFHWDSKNGLNEYDISTDGLVSGQTYTVTVFSNKVSPVTATFVAP